MKIKEYIEMITLQLIAKREHIKQIRTWRKIIESGLSRKNAADSVMFHLSFIKSHNI
ncbi:MAG: hypothetical protein ACRY3E_04990 [Candidatus Lariskella arthropodorum]